MDYFKQRRAYRNLKMYEMSISNGQNNLYRELLDYANDQGKLDCTFPMKNSALLSLTGLSEAGIKKARNELVQAGLIEYVRGRKNSFAPKYRIVKLYKDTFRATTSQKSSPEGKDKVAQTVPQTVAQKVAHKELTNTDSNPTNKNKRPRSKASRTYAPTEQPYRIAEHLYKRILEHQPDLRKPDLQKWADEVRLAHERDGRDYGKLNKLVDWAQDNDFWQANILSAKKLREKYDILTGQANREYKQKELSEHDDTSRDFGGSTRYRHEAKPEPIRTPQKGDEPF
ncbi:DNA replication protein DnaD [Lentilactobacillus parabuchneri]|uniref:DNA replication protein DnaD n=1 Tax=Lentilactobacillus parabuchneri TaxID=152331 RepID=UPI0023078898|nr:DNA replication protein DnaD [Lentilactobacillus parabuchneri]MDB1103669.1 DNA replication protein DnaD [Lentilactobacillus parabuchneri]